MAINGISSNYVKTNKGTYKKPSVLQNIAGIAVGGLAGSAAVVPISMATQKPAVVALMDMHRIYQPKIRPYGAKQEYSQIAKEFSEGLDKAFEKSGLAEKGVKIIDVKEAKDVIELEKELPNWTNKFPNIQKKLLKNMEGVKYTVADGNNAFMGMKTGRIFINKEKMSWAAFHEMGHTVNKHMSTTGKVLQKLRAPGMALSLLALLIGVFKGKKAEGEKPSGFGDKITTFIKDNSAAVAFAGMMPTVIEEGLASRNAHKLAKDVLSESNLKLLNNVNKKAWLTYAGAALAITACTWIATKVRDAIASPKKV